MKSVNTVVACALLAIGLAGNAMAAPSQYIYENGVKKRVVVKTASKKAIKKAIVKQVVAKKAAQKKIVQKVAKKARTKSYKVRSGDTLSRIAARNNTSVKKLAKLNNLWGKKANYLRIGMKIRVS